MSFYLTHFSRSNISSLRSIPNLTPETKVIVVVYIVQGLNLRSRDLFSLSDAYVKLQLGSTKIVDRPNFVKDQTNPVFGKRFVLHGSLPRDQHLQISVLDHDNCFADDLIGTTCVDIEDRYQSCHALSIGLPLEYSSSGLYC